MDLYIYVLCVRTELSDIGVGTLLATAQVSGPAQGFVEDLIGYETLGTHRTKAVGCNRRERERERELYQLRVISIDSMHLRYISANDVVCPLQTILMASSRSVLQ